MVKGSGLPNPCELVHFLSSRRDKSVYVPHGGEVTGEGVDRRRGGGGEG